MTLTELIAEVYTITGRPDRVAETSSAIKSATLRAHQSDFYYQDIYETGISFSSPEYFQQLDYRLLLPRWRALKYLRKYDAVGGVAGTILRIIPPEMLLDDYSVERTDIAYAAGALLQIKSSTKEQYFLLGCYINPDITDAGYSSWIAVAHPYAIIYEAAAAVFKATGKDEEASTYKQISAEQIAMLRMDSIQAMGF